MLVRRFQRCLVLQRLWLVMTALGRVLLCHLQLPIGQAMITVKMEVLIDV